MFVFETLLLSDDKSLQTLLRAVEDDLIILALKGADEELKTKFSKSENLEFNVKEEYKKVQEAYRALSNSSILATEKGARMGTKETHPINSPQKNQSNRISKFFLKKKRI